MSQHERETLRDLASVQVRGMPSTLRQLPLPRAGDGKQLAGIADRVWRYACSSAVCVWRCVCSIVCVVLCAWRYLY